MSYQTHAHHLFLELQNNLYAANAAMAEVAPSVIDGGVLEPGGWLAAETLLLALAGGRASVRYGMTQGESKLPTVEIAMDDPVATCANMALEDGLCGIRDGEGYAFGFWETHVLKPVPAQGNLLAARPGSLVAEAFFAGSLLRHGVASLLKAGCPPEDILWAWSSCHLPRLTDAPEEVPVCREEALCEAVLSVWVKKAPPDAKSIVDGFPYGKLRIHDMKAAVAILAE